MLIEGAALSRLAGGPLRLRRNRRKDNQRAVTGACDLDRYVRRAIVGGDPITKFVDLVRRSHEAINFARREDRGA
jgi:hypothetical protein